MERKAGFFDESGWGFFKIFWIVEAGLKCIDFAAKLKDACLEVGFVFSVNIFWDLKIDVVVFVDS